MIRNRLWLLFLHLKGLSLSFRPSTEYLRIYRAARRCPTVLSQILRQPSNLSGQSDQDETENSSSDDSGRRSVLEHFLFTTCALTVVPSLASAGEVGARITKAVTTSDIGISVRTSVVKGAQVMDQLDGKWEKFSDRFGLGSERSKAGNRPKPKLIPDPLPLQVSVAQSVICASDRVFLSTSGVKAKDLQERVETVAQKVRVSFERSGVVFGTGSPLEFETAPQFNFVVYSHFKAYSELIMERGIAFGPFRAQFERQLGDELITLISKPYELGGSKVERLQAAVRRIDDFLTVWKEDGFVALTERTTIDEDRISDWLDGIADLEFNIALDGDISLNAQVLLQEQGFRLYPSFCRCAVSSILNQVSPRDQKVSAMDYYFDTDYNSDPDKFEVKEVLLSLQLENL